MHGGLIFILLDFNCSYGDFDFPCKLVEIVSSSVQII